jgi:HAD superfamily hydrolase (TIGR01509 family)
MSLVIFDLDGVILDSRDIHYEALNKALEEINPSYKITLEEQNTKYDGLPTTTKLGMLSIEKGLPTDTITKVWKRKQELTYQVLDSTITTDNKLIEIFEYLVEHEHQIAIASNSIKSTIIKILEKKGIKKYIDLVVCNTDVKYPKPNPQMYLKCMEYFGISPRDTIIIEDSYIGRQAAYSSGAIVCPVKNSTEVTLDRIKSYLSNKEYKMKWENKNLNVLIPMAGEGSRFSKAGYTFPKPLIEVNGKPMIQLVVENLNIDANFIYLIRKEHNENFNISSMLNQITPGCKIVEVDSLTDGAACTTLLAKEYIDNDMELLIANSDQYVEWDSGEFYHSINNPNIDGSILCFENTHPKWSYVKLDDYGNVIDVKEKEVISNKASVGIYYFSKGKDYVKYAEQMIDKNITYGSSFNGKGEYYVAPVYNEAILDKKKIRTFNIKQMHGLGTPEDLNIFLKGIK